MKLNRSHALLLVGTIAAAGCVAENSGDDGAGGEDGNSAGKGGTGAAGSSSGGYAGSSKAGGAGKGSAGTTSDAGYANDAGTSAGGQSGEGGVGGEGGLGGEAGSGTAGDSSSSGAGGEGGASACSDDALVAVTCESLNSGACGIDTFLDDECAMTSETMKPRISNLARQCMLDLSEVDLCDATNTYDCIDTALKSSCPDAAAVPSCDEIIASCAEGGPTIAAETCSLWLSGMTEAGRYEMVTCMTSDVSCDFHSCAEGLVFPSAE